MVVATNETSIRRTVDVYFRACVTVDAAKRGKQDNRSMTMMAILDPLSHELQQTYPWGNLRGMIGDPLASISARYDLPGLVSTRFRGGSAIMAIEE